jgi:hypothetical protein
MQTNDSEYWASDGLSPEFSWGLIGGQKMQTNDSAGDRTQNLWFRRPAPYPLGHGVIVMAIGCKSSTSLAPPPDLRILYD